VPSCSIFYDCDLKRNPRVALDHGSTLIWLLEQGASPNTRSVRVGSGFCDQVITPLSEAARLSDPNPLLILLSYGAKIDPEAIFYAIVGHRGHPNGPATLKALIEHGADVRHVSQRWVTPLLHAVKYDQVEKMRLLLDAGADPRVPYLERNSTALSMAKEMGRMDLWAMMRASYRTATD
jgi:hypothetical protein